MANELPLEIIESILALLNPLDRIAAAATCSQWYEASLTDRLWADVVLVVENSIDEATKAFYLTRKPLQHVKLIDINLSSFYSETSQRWNKITQKVCSIEIEKSFLTEASLINLLISCHSLESLHFHNCKDTFIVGHLFQNELVLRHLRQALPNLKELCLADNGSYLSDALIDRMMSLVPQLRYLSLAGTSVSFHPGVHTRFYPQSSKEEGSKSSELVLTFDCILGHIANHATTVKYLDFSRTLMNDSACKALAKIENLQLQSLLLKSCEISHSGIAALTAVHPQLKELDVSFCARITDTALASICSCLPNLETLAVQNCRAITDTGLSNLSKLTHLRCLNIQGTEHVTSLGIQQGLLTNPNYVLRKINLGATRIESVVQLAENATLLTHLDLTSCVKAVNDTSLKIIWSHLRCLKQLRIDWCLSITDAGFIDSSIDLTPSKTTTIENLLQKEELINECNGHRRKISAISSLSGLLHLSLSGCNKVTETSLKNAFGFRELKHIDLNACSLITDAGLIALCQQNRGLQVLVLNYCVNLTDDALQKSLPILPRLQRLELHGCSKLTDQTLDCIIKSRTVNCLKHLNISHCGKMTLKKADDLQMAVPSIRELLTAGLE